MDIFKKINIVLLVSVFILGCAVPQRKVKSLPVAQDYPQDNFDREETSKKPEQIPVKIYTPGKIKIGLIRTASLIQISCQREFNIYDTKNKTKSPYQKGKYTIKTLKGKISIDSKQYGAEIRIYADKKDGVIDVLGKKYRETIIVKSVNGKLLVINEINIEDYICGVMTKEVSPNWHEESLKAQAVVARTFAMKNIGRHSSDGYDLCSNTHCQVYGGYNSEDARSNKAVYDTQGEILFYDGKLINSLYHSSCGGYTEDVKEVWNNNIKENPEYLSGVKCGYCYDDKWYNWNTSVSYKTIVNCLNSNGYKVTAIKKVDINGKTASGRIKDIVITHTKGKIWLSSNKFRTVIGANTIRSTNFVLKNKKNIVYIQGHGWGHGVGLCQWGAKGMAEKGYRYKEILKHFYRGTDLIKIFDK